MPKKPITCLLDQIMIYYAKDGMGTHYNPADNSIKCHAIITTGIALTHFIP
jgi:hypothetical protein